MDCSELGTRQGAANKKFRTKCRTSVTAIPLDDGAGDGAEVEACEAGRDERARLVQGDGLEGELSALRLVTAAIVGRGDEWWPWANLKADFGSGFIEVSARESRYKRSWAAF